jgi:ABC-type transport system involved in multi-copper enzyme maturation permease subunit
MDVGLASIELFGTLIAIFVGIGLVSKELEKRTIYTILCKPVSRSRFILGKYLGLVITLFVNVSIMGIGFFLILALIHVVPNFTIVAAVLLIFVQLLILTAFALLCSTFTTSTLSAMFTLSIYVIGHLTEDLKNLALRLSDVFSSTLLEVVYYVLPNFDYFNIKGEVVHGVSIDPATVGSILSYGLVYAAVLVAISCLIFERRDVK